MAKAQIMNGARAIVMIKGKALGLFTSVSWSVRQEKVPAYILGRYSPAEIVPTAQEPESMTMTGFKIVGKGPYAISAATQLRDLLNEEDFSIAIKDRQTGQMIFSAVGCRVTGWSSGVAQRGLSDMRLEVIGMVGTDETNTGDNEAAGAASLTDSNS